MTHRADDTNTVTDIIAWLTPDRRRWLYGIATLAFGIAVVYGLVTQDQADQWLRLAELILAGGVSTLAFTHTPKPRE